MALIPKIVQMKEDCPRNAAVLIKLGRDKEAAKLEARLHLESEVKNLTTEHFTTYPGQFEFLRGDETQGMEYRLRELMNKYCAKRNKDGSLKIDRNGRVKYETYKYFGLPDDEFFEKYNLLSQESQATDNNRFEEVAKRTIQKNKGLIWAYSVCFPFNLVILPSVFLANTMLPPTLILTIAKTIDNRLNKIVKPYLTEELWNGNYRQLALTRGRE